VKGRKGRKGGREEGRKGGREEGRKGKKGGRLVQASVQARDD
jgi:hypothetical protein